MKLVPTLALALTTASVIGAGCKSANTGGSGGTAATTGTGVTSATGPNGTAATGSSGTGTPTTGGIFTVPEPWTKDVSGLSPASNSSAIISALTSAGGWGGGKLQIDFSIPLFFANGSTPRETISADPGGYCYGGPDCDPVPLQMPIPANGNIEGSTDYTCDTSNNDCHLLVVETDQKKLYELYNSTQAGSGITALGAFIWDLTKTYPDSERGEYCTSADAGGFPIAALLPTADEVKAGDVHHAIRFILPNARMKSGVYVHPASHAGGPSSKDPNAPPYGVRLRLKASFDESTYNAGEKVIIHALKTYGMLLSDGGTIAFTFADDRTTTAKWADVGVDSHSFGGIQVSDFEVVDLGAEVALGPDCARNP